LTLVPTKFKQSDSCLSPVNESQAKTSNVYSVKTKPNPDPVQERKPHFWSC